MKANFRLYNISCGIVFLSLIALVAFVPRTVQAQKPTPAPTSLPPEPTKPPPDPTQAPEPTKAPTSTAKPPPIEPTKEPTETPLPTSTPEPVEPIVESTPTPDPAKPTVEFTPTLASTKPAVAPTPTYDPTKPTVAPMPIGERTSGTPDAGTPRADGISFDSASTGVITSPLSVVTGMVFDDRNGDGVQNTDEPGIGGVPVVVDGEVLGVTDAGGYFNLPVSGRGRTLSVVPPEGWKWQGEPMNAGEENVAIPLRRLEPVGVPALAAKVASTATVAGSVIVVVLLAFTGVASLFQTMAVRSLTRTYRQQKTHEMEYRQYQVIARRKAEIEQLLAETGDWRQVLSQVIADAVPGADTAWLTIADVSVTPVPRFDVTCDDGKRYTFTVSPSAIRRRFALWRTRAIPLDASLSPAMRVEVQTVWEHLTEQQNLELPLLPRRAEWYMVVQEQQKQRNKKARR